MHPLLVLIQCSLQTASMLAITALQAEGGGCWCMVSEQKPEKPVCQCIFNQIPSSPWGLIYLFFQIFKHVNTFHPHLLCARDAHLAKAVQSCSPWEHDEESMEKKFAPQTCHAAKEMVAQFVYWACFSFPKHHTHSWGNVALYMICWYILLLYDKQWCGERRRASKYEWLSLISSYGMHVIILFMEASKNSIETCTFLIYNIKVGSNTCLTCTNCLEWPKMCILNIAKTDLFFCFFSSHLLF